jgi:hypothetical protein
VRRLLPNWYLLSGGNLGWVFGSLLGNDIRIKSEPFRQDDKNLYLAFDFTISFLIRNCCVGGGRGTKGSASFFTTVLRQRPLTNLTRAEDIKRIFLHPTQLHMHVLSHRITYIRSTPGAVSFSPEKSKEADATGYLLSVHSLRYSSKRRWLP